MDKTQLERELDKLTTPWERFVTYYKRLPKGEKAIFRTFAKNVSQFETSGKVPTPTRIAQALELSGIATIEAKITIIF